MLKDQPCVPNVPLLLVPCAPVIAVLGWLIHRHDGGPALIAVPRVGRDGSELPMWKLRSMLAEFGLTPAQRARVTTAIRVQVPLFDANAAGSAPAAAQSGFAGFPDLDP